MKIYCSGIGGIGLSAYASLQKLGGHDVAGSDKTMSALLEDLRTQGIRITTDQSGTALERDTDLLVYSEAIPPEAPERTQAAEWGIPQQSYPRALADLQKGYKTIAVSGTHGKSSTTAMAGRVLMETGRDPTIVVGTKMRELNGRNWRKGKSDLFVVEACEYRRSFSFYQPSIILLTNCDGDHFDYYTSPEDYAQAFVDFVSTLPADGVLITHMQDPDCRAVAERSGKRVLDADAYPLVPLATPGLHMQQNAQLVLALAEHLGIPQEEAKKSLSGFSGTWRRLEIKGEVNGIVVIDDYAHHPREIRASLAAIRSAYPGRRLVTVFQPHTHDRTVKLYEDFIGAFTATDLLIIPNIYVARKDIETKEVDVDTFVNDIAAASRIAARNGKSLEETERTLRSELKSGDVLLCMGAGTVTALAAKMMEAKG